MTKPDLRPAQPSFSSGPCPKRPGWSASCLSSPTLGRSHRSSIGKARLAEAIDRTRAVLEVPEDYRIGIVPASDTGAVELAMWNLLGPRPVTVAAWESFGLDWLKDVTGQLKLETTTLTADYGALPDLSGVSSEHDVVFNWNGTTSGVRVPDADWISKARRGLTICDATSAAFAQPLDWEKLDVITFSWQKVLGGEAQHGVLVMSPRAVQRVVDYTPPWPMPKIFRLKKGDGINEGIFRGETINTPSMLCVEDYLDALNWAERVGGLDGLIGRANANLQALEAWAEGRDWIDFLAAPNVRSNTSVCLKFTDKRLTERPQDEQQAFIKKMTGLLADEEVAYDIAGYRAAPPGLRIWCGATVETSDIEALTPWLDWAFDKTIAAL
ncbi:MAG: phosphoserine transaminase [Pseudomonadota bacterium]